MSLSLVFGAALLVKSAYSGYTMPQYTYSIVCEIHKDHVQLTRGFGGEVSVTESRPITLSGHTVSLIAAARGEAVESHDTPCDGPSDELRGFADGSIEPVVIQASGGCGTPSTDRSGPASTVLKALVAALCPAPGAR